MRKMVARPGRAGGIKRPIRKPARPDGTGRVAWRRIATLALLGGVLWGGLSLVSGGETSDAATMVTMDEAKRPKLEAFLGQAVEAFRKKGHQGLAAHWMDPVHAPAFEEAANTLADCDPGTLRIEKASHTKYNPDYVEIEAVAAGKRLKLEVGRQRKKYVLTLATLQTD